MTRRTYRKATATERQQLQHAVLSACLAKSEAGTDDAHELFELPEAVEPRTWGAVTGGLQAEGLIQRVSDSKTRRSVAHGRRIGLYRVTDTEHARQRCDTLAATAARKRPSQQTLFDREG